MSKEHSHKEFEENMALIDMNFLRYEAPESLCASQNSNRNQINFNPNAYANCIGGEQPSLLFNVGSSYTDGQKSMIQLTITVNTGAPTQGTDASYWAFGNNKAKVNGGDSYNGGGSILNTITEVNHQSKSGELLYRELYKNQTRSTSRLYQIDKSRRQYLGIMGNAQYNVKGSNPLPQFPLYPVNVPVTFEIPLMELSDFFGTSQLIPPMLLSGSILRLTLAKPKDAFVFYTSDGITIATTTANTRAGSIISYSLKNMVAYLQQSELYDSVNSLILASANSLETNGLQFCYNTCFNTVFNPAGSTFNFDIQLSAAKISSLVLKFRPKNGLSFPIVNDSLTDAIDPVAAADLGELSTFAGTTDSNSLGSSFQIRLGNQIYPLYPIQSAVDMYQQTCNALNPISFSGGTDPDPLKTTNKLMAGTISYSDYSQPTINTVDASFNQGVGTGGCIFAFSFERSSAVNIGGCSSNNSRILSVEVNNMANASNFTCFASVNYLAIANVSTDNVVVNK
jgi:hypothetical protein